MHPRDRGRNTLEEAGREHLLRALRASNWVMAGPDGAAAKVGMKRTTLAHPRSSSTLLPYPPGCGTPALPSAR